METARRTSAPALPGSISIGAVAGIPIALHYSWFLVAWLIAYSLSARFGMTQPDWPPATVWATAVATAVLFFVTLVAHELAHALVAARHGLPTRSITLFALGGLAHIDRDAATAKTEFLVAAAGPLASLLIGGGCLAGAFALGWSLDTGARGVPGAVLGWLGSINIVLALFNLIPGYPLDGGRVLRAILWWRSKDADQSTRQAARVGQAVAFFFMAFGLVQILSGIGLGGLWLILIGWFLLTAAQASYTRATVTEMLGGVRVTDVMAEDCATTDARASLRAVVDDVLLRSGRRCVVVNSNGDVLGLLTPQEIRRVDRRQWDEVTAGDVMRPLDQLRTVPPDATAAEAFSTMVREDVNQLPVVDGGRLRGVVSRDQIVSLLQARAELRG